MVAHTLLDPPTTAAPLETVLHLPPPPSVNRTRKIDWRGAKKHKAWMAKADMAIIASGQRKLAKMPGRYEVHVVIDDRFSRADLDNGIKAIVDYCRRISLVIDDSKRYFRKLTVEWGSSPAGCTITLRSIP